MYNIILYITIVRDIISCFERSLILLYLITIFLFLWDVHQTSNRILVTVSMKFCLIIQTIFKSSGQKWWYIFYQGRNTRLCSSYLNKLKYSKCSTTRFNFRHKTQFGSNSNFRVFAPHYFKIFHIQIIVKLSETT